MTLALPNLPDLLDAAADEAAALAAAVGSAVGKRVLKDGRLDRAALDAEQHAAHGLAWASAYAETLRQVAVWARALEAEGRLTEAEALPAQLLAHEYLSQLQGGIPMNQGEIFRPADVFAPAERLSHVLGRLRPGAGQAVKHRIVELLDRARGRPSLEASGLDETLEAVRDQFHAFTEEKITPFAHGWHLRDELIPLSLLEELGDLGVFGLTAPEDWGGSGLGKVAMCVVSEALSRGWIGTGSLGTRSEIAAELILAHGTDDQKARFLPGIASGKTIPTAVFTEPEAGSDLGSLRTKAVRDGDVWRVSGAKTWITHAARADVMTLLVRTNPDSKDHRGLSMFLAEKPRGADGDPFPAPGMSGGEIGVIGYRGMKEYEIAFDGFEVAHANLLGAVEGQGFVQLMATFESARIQTAARAIGVAQNALDLALDYALQRRQFGGPISQFPRVANKLAMMAAEILGARRLAWFAARAKDEGRRCDLEAGMAKLTAARIAWAAADNAVQIHGGTGFAVEQPVSRVLADARILNIFEGAGEIQAQVIARRLLEGAN
ncbi:MAG: acyl-CoA dehydrogenase family protein [Alphaproteobacteria bacterium]|nr:acyl-CoA dehydrogenase family protein [Alphaproteobacteria bacterium]MBU1512566.1 acyl-CoA dehydrogenase family protein [Alphaproteobacteria bacterium]MBU2092905.1 acyl-CoA dehydrogenase family protein [Alphaproteobacteria bacterium]MBU2150856.1 acyl-CoA dehydrogenase family protein [Alphaproteobacteria bacterium]MBU2307933.1 acyl-CoA dehydrogenase family protein [Alphaproteobacteria bacterium]